MRFFIAMLSASVLFFGSCINVLARTLSPPTPIEIEMLYRYLAGDPPNFEEMALQSKEYRNANEFEKPQSLKKAINELQRLYTSIQDVDYIMLRVGSRFSQYDAEKAVYYIEAFNPSSGLSFDGYNVEFENADYFHEWHLGVEAAKKVLEKSRYRDLVLTITVRPFLASQSRENTIRGQITKVEIQNSQNQLLATMKIPDSEIRAIKRIGIEDKVAPIDQDKMEIQKLKIGSDLNTAQEWTKTRGFKTKVISDQTNNVKEIRFSTNTEALDYHSKPITADSMLLRMVGGGYGGFVDTDTEAFFGKSLNCLGKLAKPESCGELKFKKVDGNVKLVSATLLQSAEGITKQQIVSSLIERFGEPRDRIKSTVLGLIDGEHFVWGLSSIEKDSQARQLTSLPSGQHWQIEAVIAQPDASRIAVILQINDIEASESNASTGGGRIQF